MLKLSVQIPGEKRTFTTFNLEPFTYYSIVLTSENIHGLSLPSYKLKVLTLSTKEAENQGEDKRKQPVRTPNLPDVKQCCIDGKVSHERSGEVIKIFNPSSP